MLPCKKIVSLLVALALLANQGLPLYAGQTKKSSSKNQKSTSTKGKSSGGSTSSLESAVSAKVEQAKQELPEMEKAQYWLESGSCLVGITPKCIAITIENANPDKPKDKICNIHNVRKGPMNVVEEKYCTHNIVMAQAGIHSIVKNKATSLYSKGKARKEQAGAMLNLVGTWGFYYDDDKSVIRQYFKDVVSTITCGKEGITAPGIPQITAKQNQHCSEEVDALIGLAIMDYQYYSSAINQDTDLINNYLKKAWSTSDGVTVIMGGITALVSLRLKKPWEGIETFITTTAKPKGIKFNLSNLLSVEKLAEMFYSGSQEQARKAKKWYNDTNKGFSWRAENICASYPGVFGKTCNKKGSQPPYTNAFEEIGHIIGSEAAKGNGYAQRVAKDYIQRAIKYIKNPYHVEKMRSERYSGGTITSKVPMNFDGHWPVVLGILSGASNNPKAIVPSGNEAGVYRLIVAMMDDWWDVNAGTQTHIRRVVGSYYQALSGEKVTLASYGGEKFKDKAKRYNTFKTTRAAGEIADTAIFIVSLPSLLAAGPAIGKGIWSTLKNLGRGTSRMGSKTVNGILKTSGTATAKTEKTAAQATKTVTKSSTPKQMTLGSKKVKVKSGSERKPSGKSSKSKGGKKGASKTSKPAETGNAGKTGAKAGKQRAEPTPRTGNNPAQTEGNVTGPLDQQVQEAKVGAGQSQTAAERLSNPEAPKPDLSPSAKPSSVMQRVKEETEDIKKAFSRWWKDQSAQAQKVGIMPGEPQINPFAGLGDAYKGVKAERQAAAAAAAGKNTGTVAAETDMLTPLGNMKTTQAMQVLDPQATKLPIFRKWESFASKMRRQQGINRRINEIRSSLSKSIDGALSDVALLKGSVPKHVQSRLGDLEKKLQGIFKEMQALAADSKINQSTEKVESLLEQIASKEVSGVEKQKLFAELNKEREELFTALESYRDRIVPELQRARGLLESVRGESDLSRTYNNIRNIEKRLSNAEDLLKGDLTSLKQWSSGKYVEAIGSDIEGMVAKEKRIEEAARNKAAKQERKAKQREQSKASQKGKKQEEPSVQNTPKQGEGTSLPQGSEALKNVSSVDSNVSGVYALKDASGRTVAYAKATNATEVARTKQVHGIIDGGGLRAKYPKIEIEYPQVLTEDLSDLPVAIQKSISQDLQRVSAQNSTRSATLKKADAREFVMSSVDTEGMNLGDLDMLKFDVRDLAWEQPNPTAFFNEKMQSSMLQHLGGKPITQAEWTEVRGLVQDLNRAGFEHGDLGQNLFIKRSASGKLKVTLIDFEATTVKADQDVLNALGQMFQEYGALIP